MPILIPPKFPILFTHSITSTKGTDFYDTRKTVIRLNLHMHYNKNNSYPTYSTSQNNNFFKLSSCRRILKFIEIFSFGIYLMYKKAFIESVYGKSDQEKVGPPNSQRRELPNIYHVLEIVNLKICMSVPLHSIFRTCYQKLGLCLILP